MINLVNYSNSFMTERFRPQLFDSQVGEPQETIKTRLRLGTLKLREQMLLQHPEGF